MGIFEAYNKTSKIAAERVFKAASSDNRYPAPKGVPFDIIDDTNFACYINTEVGTKFLRWVKTVNFKLWNFLAKEERNIDNLGFKQKKHLFFLFNKFFINNYKYNTYVEISVYDKNANNRYDHVFHSSYGDKFLTLLSKKYPSLHKRIVEANFEITLLKDTDQNLFFKLFNRFFKTKCANIDIPNPSPAIKKHLEQAKKKVCQPQKAASPPQALTKQSTKPLETRRPSTLTRAHENKPAEPLKQASAEDMLKDFLRFYAESLKELKSRKPSDPISTYLKDVSHVYAGEELKYIYMGIQYAIGDDFEFARQNEAMFVVKDRKQGRYIMYDKQYLKNKGYNPDNIVIIQDKKSGKVLIYDKLQLINNARQYETLYQNALAGANMAAEEINTALWSFAQSCRETRAGIEADKKFKAKYGEQADIALTVIKWLIVGNYKTPVTKQALSSKEAEFKSSLISIIRYRVLKENTELNSKSRVMAITPSLYILLDFVKGDRTLDNICASLMNTDVLSFKKPGSSDYISVNAKAPSGGVIKHVNNGLLEIARSKSFADNFIDSFKERSKKAGSSALLVADAAAGAVKGLLVDMPVTIAHCAVNPLLAPLFFFNAATPEGFKNLKKDFFRVMEEGGEGEIAAYVSFNLSMAAGMAIHGGGKILKGAKNITLKLTKEKIEVIRDNKEAGLPQEDVEVEAVIKFLQVEKLKPSKVKIIKKKQSNAARQAASEIELGFKLMFGKDPLVYGTAGAGKSEKSSSSGDTGKKPEPIRSDANEEGSGAAPHDNTPKSRSAQLLHRLELHLEAYAEAYYKGSKKTKDRIKKDCNNLLKKLGELDISDRITFIVDLTMKIPLTIFEKQMEEIIQIINKTYNEAGSEESKAILINAYENIINNAIKFEKKGHVEVLLQVMKFYPEEVFKKCKAILVSFMENKYFTQSMARLERYSKEKHLNKQALHEYSLVCQNAFKELSALIELSDYGREIMPEKELLKKKFDLIQIYYLDLLNKLKNCNEAVRKEILKDLPEELWSYEFMIEATGVPREEIITNNSREGKIVREVRHDFRGNLSGLCSALYLFNKESAVYKKTERLLKKFEKVFHRHVYEFKLSEFYELLENTFKDFIKDLNDINLSIEGIKGENELINMAKEYVLLIKDDFLNWKNKVGLNIEQIKLNLTEINLRKAVSEIARTYAHSRIKERQIDIEIQINIPPDLTAGVNPVSFTAWFNNLFQNAANMFYDIGGTGCKIMVTGEKCTKKNKISIFCEDNGCGVEDIIKKRVFDANVSKSGGTGFGLSHMREHIEAHGGRIYVVDGEFGGAKFVIELPIDPTKPMLE